MIFGLDVELSIKPVGTATGGIAVVGAVIEERVALSVIFGMPTLIVARELSAHLALECKIAQMFVVALFARRVKLLTKELVTVSSIHTAPLRFVKRAGLWTYVPYAAR